VLTPSPPDWGEPPDTDKASNASIFRNIMLGYINSEGCTFCQYDCDYGISDEQVWLPLSASTGYCTDCHRAPATFYDEWTISSNMIGKPTRLKELDRMSNAPPLKGIDERNAASRNENSTEPQRPARKTKSLIDGRDTTRFQPALFCRGCPWRQIDLGKVRICEDCKRDKFMIIRHRHETFVPIAVQDTEPPLFGEQQKGRDTMLVQEARSRSMEPRSKRCMVCTGHATHVCDGCPLRVCAICTTMLVQLCKFSITSYARTR
jgi:hypothetical protein